LALPTWHSFGTLFTLFIRFLFIRLYVGTRSYGTATSADRGEGSFHWKGEWKANCKPARLFALILFQSGSNLVARQLPQPQPPYQLRRTVCLEVRFLQKKFCRWLIYCSAKAIPVVPERVVILVLPLYVIPRYIIREPLNKSLWARRWLCGMGCAKGDEANGQPPSLGA
jgi:hypothetical protein